MGRNDDYETGDFTPQQLKIVDSEVPHVRYAVATTATGGLQVMTIDDRAAHAALLVRAEGSRTVCELQSFLDELVRRPLGESGTLWGNDKTSLVSAIYNDHTSDQPGHRDDMLRLSLLPDEDWQKWHQVSGTYYSQADFGDLVEELLHTVVAPDQAELLEIIDSIRSTSKAEFNSEIERARGGQKVTFNTEVTASAGRTGKLEIPQTVTLRLRPWEGHASFYEVPAWFRLKVSGGTLTLTIKLKPTRQIIRAAWGEVTAAIAAATEKPVLAHR